MTDHRAGGDAGEPFDVDPTTAYPARIFDYLLGGNDNFAADREVAHQLWGNLPGGLDTARTIARAVHDFVVAAVGYLAGEAGIRQFLNVGNVVRVQHNVHEVAQRIAPESRVVYVVSDPVVLAHAHELRRSSPTGLTTIIPSDLRDLRAVMQEAAATLDLTQPVGLIVSGVLHYVSGPADPHRFVAALLKPVVPGSHLVVSHAASDVADGLMVEMAKRQEKLANPMRWPFVPRTHDEVARFFDGLELVDPGLVTIDRWHPPSVLAPVPRPMARASGAGSAPPEGPPADPLPWYGAVGRKPG